VISDIFGVSGRDMQEALIAGQRDPCAGPDEGHAAESGRDARGVPA
jgi:hypothetical protein